MREHYHEHTNNYYNGFQNDMTYPMTNCSRFERRHDFSTFNMADYTACENCRHLSADNRCIAHMGPYGRME